MQNAKDSFYVALRDRLAALNPARVVKVRGVARPSLLVEDAEAPVSELANDVFVLRWTSVAEVQELRCGLMSLGCEVHYGTSGTQGNAGLDLGRALSEMDRELLAVLEPMWTQKMTYTVTPAAAMQTRVFWTAPELGAAAADRNVLGRVVKVTVYAFEEPGEL